MGEKGKRKVDWRIFGYSTSVCAIIAALLAKWLRLSFWIVFPIVVLGLFINGLLATWEDEQPGGFCNPNPEEPRDDCKER